MMTKSRTISTHFFCNVGSTLNDDILELPNDSVNKFVTLKYNPMFIFFDPVTEMDIIGIIFSMKDYKVLAMMALQSLT